MKDPMKMKLTQWCCGRQVAQSMIGADVGLHKSDYAGNRRNSIARGPFRAAFAYRSIYLQRLHDIHSSIRRFAAGAERRIGKFHLEAID
ncbi:hypothetical protein [Nocardia sp. NPDC050175]|uniref:hypothetical protein n=1 Tax=Nocardia sp. NPDC050175 TaxID=3364317 RepID=UPI0037B68D62